jgi:hypothetical protein
VSEQTVVIGGVESVKSGTTNGHAWTIYKVTDGNGSSLGSCLQELADSAKALIGERAVVENFEEPWEKDGKKGTNLKLKSVLPAAPEPAGNGEVDWDGKELRGHIRACYAIAASFVSANGSDFEDVRRYAELILARVYDPSTPDKPASVFIPPETAAVGATVPDDSDIPF